MAGRTQNQKKAPAKAVYEEERSGGLPGRVIAAAVLLTVALVLLYIMLTEPQEGTFMGTIRQVLAGIGGDLALLIPLYMGGLGAAMIAAEVLKKRWLRVILSDTGLTLVVFTLAHAFQMQKILDAMGLSTFANFVSKSRLMHTGGGLIGSLLSWPMYKVGGTGGIVLGCLLLMLLFLWLSGHLAQIIRVSGILIHKGKQANAVRKNERMFEYENFPETKKQEPARAVKAQAAQTANLRGGKDPFAEYDRQNAAARPLPRTTKKQAPVGDPMNGVHEVAGDGVDPRGRRKVKTGARTTAERPNEEDLTIGALKKGAKKPKIVIAEEEETSKETPEWLSKSSGKVRKAPPVRVKADETLETDAAPAAETPAAEPKIETKAEKKLETKPVRTPEPVLFDPELYPEDESEPEKDPYDDIFDVIDEEDKSADIEDEPEEDLPRETPSVELDEDNDYVIEPEAYETPDEPAAEPSKPVLQKIQRTITELVEDEKEPYNYPPIDLLTMGDGVVQDHRDADRERAKLLVETLEEFGIHTTLTGIAHGPAVTRFELLPAKGIKVARITALADDIAMHLAALSVRIEAPIPGKAAVGVEIPNDKIEMVRLRDVLESPEACKATSKIAVGLGKDNAGRYIIADIAKMPHVLIAGQTGSGKSVCINSIIASILFRATPDEVRLVLIDPKMVELSIYNGIPHLVCPVVTDPKKAASALDWAVAEMSRRYQMFADKGVRNIQGYNRALTGDEKPMPQMVIIIDELADLMMVASGEVEESICRIAQLARACGMHLVIATQRPSVNVVTGIIKANIPTRIAFSVASQVDSRTMIDHGGAEKLLGNGDMLYVPNGSNKSIRVQGAWVSDEEVNAMVEYIKDRCEATYDEDMIEKMNNATKSDQEIADFNSEYDDKLAEAVEIVVEAGQASVSMLQRRMRIGYARAGRLIDEMEQRGIVSEADGAKPRTVLITRDQMMTMFED